MTSTSTISRVWIAPGCIVCNLCEDTCPQVFDVQAETCVIRPSAQRYYLDHYDAIIQAAAECPVEVIRIAGVNEPPDEAGGETGR
ncbi:MAG: ferredoxin [Phycisphaerales bacterium]|nr:ferredoxin [Phycisphaerales bacterium]